MEFFVFFGIWFNLGVKSLFGLGYLCLVIFFLVFIGDGLLG